MSLTTQTIPVLFEGGLSQKTAEQLVIPGKFLTLENCVRRKQGKIQKRFGFEDFSKTVVGGDDLSNGKTLLKLNDDLLQIANDKIYSYIPSSDQWVDRGFISSLTTSSTPIIRNSDTQAMPDIVSYNGLIACVWEDSRSGKAIQVSVFDATTGAAVLTDANVSTSGGRPKIVGINNRLIITYIDGTTLKGAYIETNNPTSVVAFGASIDTGIVDSAYDLIAWSSSYALIAYRSSSVEITLSYLTSNGVLGSAATALPAPAVITYNDGVALTLARAPDLDYIYLAATSTAATDTDFWAFRANLLSFDTVTVNSTDADNITIGARTGGAIDVYMEFPGASNHFAYIVKAVLAYDGTSISITSASAVFKRSVGLGSKAFVSGNFSYVIGIHESALQSTYFVLRSDGFISSRNFAGLGGGLTKSVSGSAKSGLPRVTGNFTTALQVKNKLTAETETILSSNAGIERLSISLTAPTYTSAQLGENLHIAGGILLNYDGNSVTEHGFNLFPENITITQSNGSPGIATGLYSYRVVYEWVDAKGQIHQSAPSIIENVNVSGGTVDQVTLTIPTLRLTLKTAPTRSEVRVVVYRTVAGPGQVMYRLSEVANSTTSDTVTVIDKGDINDTDLQTKQILYTTGGTVENIAPAASTNLTLHKNRLFIGGLDKRGFINYSREYVAGEGVAFSDLFELPVDPASGNVTALASMDEKLIIFKQDRIYSLVGDGPLDTGAQDDFSKPQLIAGDIGCINPASITTIQDGLIFKSDKGIYLLTRSLQFVFIGQDVEDFNNLSITSAVVLEDDNEVRFTTSDGSALIFNYFFNQWSTFSNYEAASAINAVGGYVHLKSDGTVRRETPNLYLDAGGRISMVIETSWLAFAGVQGYQRVREWSLLGDFITDHYTKVKLFYDYEKFASETVYFNVDEGLDLSYYGDDAIYGDSTVYGGSGSGVFQFSSRPRRQKCQAVKLRIEDIDTKTAGGGGSLNLVGLTFEVGSKNAINKQMIGNKSIGGG